MSKKNLTVLAIVAAAIFLTIQLVYWTFAFWAWMVDTTVGEFAQWWFLCAVPATLATIVAMKHGHLMSIAFQGGAATYWLIAWGVAWGPMGWAIGGCGLLLAAGNWLIWKGAQPVV